MALAHFPAHAGLVAAVITLALTESAEPRPELGQLALAVLHEQEERRAALRADAELCEQCCRALHGAALRCFQGKDFAACVALGTESYQLAQARAGRGDML